MDDEKIQIALLGPPQVSYKGQQIQIKRRILRKLLYFLASQSQPVNREEVCDMFWPEEDEAGGRKNLRESISLLRAVLPIENTIVTQNDLLMLDPEKVSVDVLIFERISEKLRKKTDLVVNGRLPEKTYTEIRDTLRSWRTSEFLDGIQLIDSLTFQYWVLQKRETLYYWRQMMMEWMANHYIATGNLNEALYWLSTAVLKDRQNTELNYLTLKCLKDLGYRSAAIHYCDVIESIYRDGETVAVPKVLKDLVNRVRDDDDFREEKKLIPWDLFEQKEVDFLARYDLVDHLVQCVNRGGVYQLIGEPGSGKTRTLKEFYTNLEISPRIAYCRARKEEQNIPYQVFVQGIRDIVTEKEWQQLDFIYALTLLQIFPEIPKVRKDIRPEDVERSIELKRLIPEAIYELVLIIIGEKRGLLIIDDAHWCDEGTIQTLGYIFEREKDKTANTCILSLRMDKGNPFITSLFSNKKTFYNFENIEISPLTLEQTAFIYHSITGQPKNSQVINWLYEGSGGNISYLLEILNEIETSNLNIVDLSNKKEWPINNQLHSLISDRIAKYHGLTDRVLSILAIAWQPVNEEVFFQLPLGSVLELNEAMSQLERDHLISWGKDENGVNRYQFVHGVVKQVVSSGISKKIRQTIIKRYFSQFADH